MLGVAPLCHARSSYAASRPRGARCRSRSLASRPVSGVGFAVGLPVWLPHALGHLLLDTAGHADEGIMRWGWAAADLGCHDVADRRCRFSGCECTMGGSPATRARAVHRAARMAEARSSLRPLPTARRRWYPVVRSDSGRGGAERGARLGLGGPSHARWLRCVTGAGWTPLAHRSALRRRPPCCGRWCRPGWSRITARRHQMWGLRRRSRWTHSSPRPRRCRKPTHRLRSHPPSWRGCSRSCWRGPCPRSRLRRPRSGGPSETRLGA